MALVWYKVSEWKRLNKCLTNSFAKVRSFAGEKIKQLSYHAAFSLVDETSNTTLIHEWCNDISNKTSTLENIAKDLLEMAKTCRGYGASDIFMSSIICRRNKFLNKKVKCVNFLCVKMCEVVCNVWRKRICIYIYSGNWSKRLMVRWYLSEYGKAELSRNFIYFLNPFRWLPFYTRKW